MKSRFLNISIIDWLFFTAILMLSLIGLMVYYSLTIGQGWQVIAGQGALIVGGWLIFFWLMRIDYRFLRALGGYFYIIMIVLLLAVFLFGVVKYGARRWLDLGFLSFQPSELAKICLLLFLAKYMAGKGESVNWRDMLVSMLVMAVPFGLVLWQPDLGTAMVMAVIWLAVIFVSPLPRKYLWILFGVFILALPFIWMNMHDYQQTRILTFIDPARDPYGAGYNVLQSQIAVGSGGMWGQGLGKGWQSQLHFLPVAYSDFAFAVFAEEFGFVGSISCLLIYLYLIWYIWRVGFSAIDQFGFYLSIAIGAVFFFQFAVNIAMNIGIMPVTGIPLPLVSSGGTAIVTNFLLLGLVYSVKRNNWHN